MERKNLWLILGALGGALSVIAGAAGAHLVEPVVSPETYVTYYKAVRYQMYHSIALVLVSLFSNQTRTKAVNSAGWLFLFGILSFSGSLYLIVFAGLQWMEWVTMIGGFLFVFGWISLAISGFSKNNL